MTTRLAIWRDRRGQLSALRVATLLVLLMPLLKALVDAHTIARGARPLEDLIHRAGFWALMFLLLSLAVTPLRQIARSARLADVRRMIGVTAFCYAAAHISLFAANQTFDLVKVFGEIARRIYLAIGFTALVGLTALAATSTDGMVRRLGSRRWQLLHQASYVIAALALVHFFQQTKADMWVPTLFAGLFAWLMTYRLMLRLFDVRAHAWSLLALAASAAVLTFAGEAIGIAIVFRVSPLLVLQTAFDFDPAVVRPGWLVLGAGLCVVAVHLARATAGSVQGAAPSRPQGDHSAPAWRTDSHSPGRSTT